MKECETSWQVEYLPMASDSQLGRKSSSYPHISRNRAATLPGAQLRGGNFRGTDLARRV